MRYRVLELNGRYRVQRSRFGLFWRNLQTDGTPYELETVAHQGHSTFNTDLEALALINRLMKSKAKPKKWRVIYERSQSN